MNKLQFTRTNGNVPKSLNGEDHISGLLVYFDTIPEGFKGENKIQAVSTIDKAESLGITAKSTNWEVKVLHYQLSEIFRLNPGISLYVGIFPKKEGANSFSEIKEMQNFASGKIRQIGVYCGDVKLAAAQVTALQGVATELEAQDTPLSILYAPKVEDVKTLTSLNLAGSNQKNVSVVIAQAGSGVAKELFDEQTPEEGEEKNSVTALGVVLGILSSAAVHESIAWVKKFPAGVEVPAFSDGTLYHTLDRAVIEGLDSARFLFLVTYSGLSGCYINDSHTLDTAISDYAYIEAVRTMDKAVRGIRTYLIPELSGPVYIDAETGQLQAYTVNYLEMVANRALEDMEKAGELSGYSVEIDPEQNVLTTSTIEIVIKQVAVGVMRKINVKIGFTTSI